MVDCEIEGGGEQVGEAGEIVGAETAADAERSEGRIGEDDALARAALELDGEFGERLAAEAQQRGLPGEGAGNFLGGGGGDDDRGGGRDGRERDDGALAGTQQRDRLAGDGRVGGRGLGGGFELHDAFGDEDVDGGGLEVDVEGGADRADIDIAGADDEGPCGIFGDGEMGFAAREEDAAFSGCEVLGDFAAGVELDDGAVGEGELARGGGGRAGLWRYGCRGVAGLAPPASGGRPRTVRAGRRPRC